MSTSPHGENHTSDKKDVSGIEQPVIHRASDNELIWNGEEGIESTDSQGTDAKELMDKIKFLESQVNNMNEELSEATIKPKIITTESVIKSSETVVAGLGLSILGVGIIGFIAFFVLSILGMILY